MKEIDEKTDAIKPCPFCLGGCGEVEIHEEKQYGPEDLPFQVVTNCGAKGPPAKADIVAIDRWNYVSARIEQLDFYERVMNAAFHADVTGEVYWHPSGPSINCNDFFYWGCADGEDITPENVEVFEQALKDGGIFDGTLLFCARARKMRPQGAAYSQVDKENWHLFDECGPERETGLGNPYKRGEYKTND